MAESNEQLGLRYDTAVQMAAKQLGYRSLSAQGLKEKLLDKGVLEDAADYAIAYLQERGLLCDQAYAQSVTHSYANRGYGAMRIRQELRKRGVAGELAQEALQDLQPNMSAMQKLLDKRLRGDISDRKEVDKAVAALQRRGFGWQDIRQALAQYGASLDDKFD